VSQSLPNDDGIICFCNAILLSTIKNAIADGACSIKDVYDQTSAGVGPCGGTCRALIQGYLAPASPKPDSNTDPEEFLVSRELVEAVSLFNRRYYWEAHEILESLWMHEKDRLKTFYQGLIQACATFYHVLNSNPRSVVKLALEAHEKLKSFAPETQGLKLEPLLEALRRHGADAREIMGRTKQGFDYDALPRIPIRSF
jgi:bacterioferritin-associated ferredoxin